MDRQERMIIKKKLKLIAKSTNKFNEDIFDYYMDYIDEIGFTDREIGYLIFDILFGFRFNKNDYEIKVADYLFKISSLKSHPAFNRLLLNSVYNSSAVTLELLLKHNIVIEQNIIDSVEDYLNHIEQSSYIDLDYYINTCRQRMTLLQQFARKQKIGKIVNKKRNKARLINDIIINPLLLSKANCN